MTAGFNRCRNLISMKRVAELAVGIGGLKAVNAGFDYLLYPFVIYRLGVRYGGSIMIFLDMVACLAALWLYDRSKRDWVGMETLKCLAHAKGSSRLRGMLSRMLERSSLVVFVFLSVKADAFITTLYFRQGTYNGMTRRDWLVLILSLLLSNLYWIFACRIGISLTEDILG